MLSEGRQNAVRLTHKQRNHQPDTDEQEDQHEPVEHEPVCALHGHGFDCYPLDRDAGAPAVPGPPDGVCADRLQRRPDRADDPVHVERLLLLVVDRFAVDANPEHPVVTHH